MAIRTRIRVRRRPKNMILAAITLLALATVLTACGGSDPVSRSFENEAPADDDHTEPTLPATVRSEVGLSFRKGHFVVQAGSDRLFCLDGRTGAIFEKPRKGKAHKVGEFKTDEVGADNVKVKKPGGTYYATLAKGTFAKYGSVSECSGAKSPNVRV